MTPCRTYQPAFLPILLFSSSIILLSSRSKRIEISGNFSPSLTYCGFHFLLKLSQLTIFCEENGKNGSNNTARFAVVVFVQEGQCSVPVSLLPNFHIHSAGTEGVYPAVFFDDLLSFFTLQEYYIAGAYEFIPVFFEDQGLLFDAEYLGQRMVG